MLPQLSLCSPSELISHFSHSWRLKYFVLFYIQLTITHSLDLTVDANNRVLFNCSYHRVRGYDHRDISWMISPFHIVLCSASAIIPDYWLTNKCLLVFIFIIIFCLCSGMNVDEIIQCGHNELSRLSYLLQAFIRD